MPVSPRVQPLRQAAVEVEYFNPDSEDAGSSDNSTSPMDLDELLDTNYGASVTDTEHFAGVEKDEYREKAKKKR